jgi:type IV pilus assembly protein PilA
VNLLDKRSLALAYTGFPQTVDAMTITPRSHARARNKNRRAFTLLELVVALVVLGILAALAVPTYTSVINTAKSSVATSNALSLASDAIAIAATSDTVATEAQFTTAVGEDNGAVSLASPDNYSTDGTTSSITLASGSYDVVVSWPDSVNGAPYVASVSGGSGPTTTTTTLPLGPAILATLSVDPSPNYVSSDSSYVWATIGGGAVNELTEINSSTATVVRTITPPGIWPGPSAAFGTDVWVENELTGNSVSEIDGTTGDVINTVTVGADVVGIAIGGSDLWVSYEGSGSGGGVTELNASTGSVINAITLDPAVDPYSVAANATDAWVADPVSGTVTELDATTGDTVRTITLPDGYTATATNVYGSTVWLTGNSFFAAMDASTGAVTAFPLLAGYDIVGTPGAVWVTTSDSTVLKIDPSTGAVIAATSFTGADSTPETLAYDGTNVWTANATGNTVSDFLP